MSFLIDLEDLLEHITSFMLDHEDRLSKLEVTVCPDNNDFDLQFVLSSGEYISLGECWVSTCPEIIAALRNVILAESRSVSKQLNDLQQRRDQLKALTLSPLEELARQAE